MRQVKLVGCIVELEDASTNTEYTIEDTTGRLKVIFRNLLVSRVVHVYVQPKSNSLRNAAMQYNIPIDTIPQTDLAPARAKAATSDAVTVCS